MSFYDISEVYDTSIEDIQPLLFENYFNCRDLASN